MPTSLQQDFPEVELPSLQPLSSGFLHAFSSPACTLNLHRGGPFPAEKTEAAHLVIGRVEILSWICLTQAKPSPMAQGNVVPCLSLGHVHFKRASSQNKTLTLEP